MNLLIKSQMLYQLSYWPVETKNNKIEKLEENFALRATKNASTDFTSERQGKIFHFKKVAALSDNLWQTWRGIVYARAQWAG